MSSSERDTVVDSFPEKVDAVRSMHRYARMLRRRRATDRFGVYVEPRCGVWWVMLHDRRTR